MARTITVIIAILAVVWIVYATIRVQQGVDRVTDSPAPVDTVYMAPDTVRIVIERAIEQKVGVVERIVTKEVKPDTVFIATSEPIPVEELPAFGIQEVKKDGKRLEVTALARDGSSVEKSVYTLPSANADYRLTSGSKSSMLRTSRGWNLVKLEGELTVIVGSAGVAGIAQGPVSIQPIPNVAIRPAVLADGEGVSLGVSATYKF